MLALVEAICHHTHQLKFHPFSLRIFGQEQRPALQELKRSE